MKQILFSNMLLYILVWVIALYLLFGLPLFFFQRKIIYYPTKQDFYSCPAFDDSEKLDYNGTRFYYKKNSEKLAIFYHGNAGSACDRTYIKKFFDDKNYSFIIVEYAGYSNDVRKPSQTLILNDVRNIHEYTQTLRYSTLIIFGESVGAGAASYHASISDPDKIVLISSFNNLTEFVQSQFPIYPARLLLREHYPNDEWLKDYKGRVVFIHGTEDSIIPPWHARKLYETLATEKEYIAIEGADHNNLYRFAKTGESIKNILD